MDGIGENIRKIRMLLGIKQAVMAGMLDVSVNTYGKMERNEIRIRPERLTEIAVIFNIKPDYIINLELLLEQVQANRSG
ncbi:helix-turn-helix protein [compost metagenome]